MKTGYYLELVTLETIKLLESTKSKINKDKSFENVPKLEINKIIPLHYCQQDYQRLSTIFKSLIYIYSYEIVSHIARFFS